MPYTKSTNHDHHVASERRRRHRIYYHSRLIEEKFGKEVELIIDGGIGSIEPSTIVNCTNGEAEIVRQGKGILNDF